MKRASSLRLTLWPMPPISTATLLTSRGDRLRLRLAHGGARVLDRLHDVHVAGAAAEVPRDRLADLLFRRIRVRLEQCDARHHHPRRAEPALKAVLLVEALLHGVQTLCGLEALDGADGAAVRLDREDGAGLHRTSVEEDGARAAVRRVAADVRAGHAERLADEVDEEQAGLDRRILLLAVDRDADGVRVGHGSAPSLCARDRAPDGARREHAHDVALVFHRSTQIAGRLRLCGRRLRRRGDRLLVGGRPDERGLGPRRADRGASDVRETAARRRHLPRGVEHDVDGGARDGEVADLPLELQVRAAALRRGLGDADLGEDLVRLERRRERIDEELVDGDHALALRGARDHARAERQHRRRVVVRGVGVREVAAHRREVAHERIGDDRHGVGEDRVARPDRRVLLELAFASERADAQLAVLLHVRESVDAVDVDESAWLREPELHERDERLAAGEDLRLATALREELERVRKIACGLVLEAGWDHVARSNARSIALPTKTPTRCVRNVSEAARSASAVKPLRAATAALSIAARSPLLPESAFSAAVARNGDAAAPVMAMAARAMEPSFPFVTTAAAPTTAKPDEGCAKAT